MATVTLNRPEALNALTLAMLEALAAWLAQWEHDDRVRVVVLRGAGGRCSAPAGISASCAKCTSRVWNARSLLRSRNTSFDHRIHRYPKPVVAVMDGITIGRGMGLAQGATLRIAGPRTRIAMPETLIGFFPDVGGTWFLPRAPGEIGLYLGLVGATLGAADSLYAGLVECLLHAGCHCPARRRPRARR